LASAGANNATTYFGAADANGVYSINSVAMLKDYLGFADQSSLKFRLETDLDMAATPGVFVPYVAGSLDTNNRITINNLALRQYTSNQGFIGHLRNNTTQATANVAMNNLTVNGNITGTMNLGLVAGSDWQRNITNVTTTGSVTGQDTYYFMNPDHDDRGENNSGSGNSWSNVGGVVGYAWGRNTNRASNLQFTGISSSATVTGVNAVGGLAGHVQFGSITNSNTTGAVTSVAQTSINVYRTGGLVGYLNSTNSEISNSNHTVGLVKGYNYVGGLAGEAFGQLGVNVSANSTPTYNTFVSSNVEGNGERIGGLVGSFVGGSYITNAEMTGTVTGWRTAGVPDYTNGGYTGGIGGYVSSTDVKYVRFTGSLVKGSHQTGGLIDRKSVV
jgi:hypothetical protein